MKVAFSITELFQHVHDIGCAWERRWSPVSMQFWFRGLDDVAYDLNPGLLRPPNTMFDLQNLEYQAGHDFRIRGRPYLTSDPRNSWEELFLMQHYGFPTRLLDWTQSLAVAAYFAVRDITSEKDGVVWAMSPQWLVHKATGNFAIHLFANHPFLEPYKLSEKHVDRKQFDELPPVPIIPEHIDDRIIAQRGRFTIHTFKIGSLEELGKEDEKIHGDAKFLHPILIPASAKRTVRQQVHIFGGASEDTLFPGLDGLARGFRWELLEDEA